MIPLRPRATRLRCRLPMVTAGASSCGVRIISSETGTGIDGGHDGDIGIEDVTDENIGDEDNADAMMLGCYSRQHGYTDEWQSINIV